MNGKKTTVRDLIQFLLLHCDLDDTFYGFLLTTINEDEMKVLGEEDVQEWIEETYND